MTDINDLDRYIGRYVDLQNEDDGAAGFLIDVDDSIGYTPHPHRLVVLDWGLGFPVGADTVMTFPEALGGQEVPAVVNPVRAMHLAMHDDESCTDMETCLYESLSARALKSFRIWQMKQEDAYWKNTYATRVKAVVESDPRLAREIIRDAVRDGAPEHFVYIMNRIVEEASRGKEWP